MIYIIILFIIYFNGCGDIEENGYKATQEYQQAVPLGRDGAGAAVLDGKMWMIGGWNSPQIPSLSTNEIYYSTGGAWQFWGNAPFSPRHTFGCVVLNAKIYVIGGDCAQGVLRLNGDYQDDVWSFDGTTWKLEADNLSNLKRVLFYTCVFDNKIWIFGGQKRPDQCYNDTTEYLYRDVWNTSDGVNWNLVNNDIGFYCNTICGSIDNADKIYIVGGSVKGTPRYMPQAFQEVYTTTDGVTFTQITSIPQKLYYHNVFYWDYKVWLIAGADNNLVNLTNVYYLANDQWHPVDINWIPRHACSVWNYNRKMYLGMGNSIRFSQWNADIWTIEKL